MATLDTLVSDGANGERPRGSLIADANGDLFGTTNVSGPGGGGTVFEIARTSTGYATTPTVLASFAGGASPFCSLIADADGNLFGTTGAGGASGDGTVFEITDSGYVVAPCFCRGTRILIARGEVAVEALEPGDTVVLADGGAASIVWIGRRRMEAAEPVRVRAHAFGPGLPLRGTLAEPCAPMVLGGPRVEAIRERLACMGLAQAA